MRLRERYRRLTFWNKIAFWGSVASIIGVLFMVGTLIVPKYTEHKPVKPNRTLLLFLSDNTKVRKAPDTGLIHTYYFFRSRSGGLRDISIKIKFDGPFVTAAANIHGAFVEEQNTRMIPDNDSSGFSYTTGYLREGNDIVIDIISRNPLKVVSMHLSP